MGITYPKRGIISVVNRRRKFRFGSQPVIDIDAHSTESAPLVAEHCFIVESSEDEATAVKHYHGRPRRCPGFPVNSDGDLVAISGRYLVICLPDVALGGSIRIRSSQGELSFLQCLSESMDVRRGS